MSNLFDKDWDLTEIARILEEDMTNEDKMEDAMIRASNKAELTREELLDVFTDYGLMGVYTLGQKNMYEYLKE